MTESRLAQAAALAEKARSQLRDLTGEYEASLQAQDVSPELKISIKNLLENLRSALDYCAVEIVGRKIPGSVPDHEIHFPIMRKDQGEVDMNHRLAAKFPGLGVAAPEIEDYLRDCQWYRNARNSWLPEFAELCNSNKHQALSPQTRIQSARVKVTGSFGGSVSWDPESVRFGEGVSILGAPVNPQTQMPEPSPGTTTTVEVWVAFMFDLNSQIVLPFLQTCAQGVRNIVDDLSRLLA